MHKFYLSFISIFISVASFSQPKLLIKNQLKDAATKQSIAYASITNLTTQQTVLSNKSGYFSIETNSNQLLSISAIGYMFDTLRIINELQDSVLYVKPLAQELIGVTVFSTTKFSKYQRDSLQRRDEFFKDMGSNPLPTFSTSNSGAGLGISLDRFSAREKRKRKAIELFDAMEKEQYINYYFNPQTVSKFAALPVDSLLHFVQANRPGYKWLRKHNSTEDLLYYVNEKLKQEAKKEN